MINYESENAHLVISIKNNRINMHSFVQFSNTEILFVY